LEFGRAGPKRREATPIGHIPIASGKCDMGKVKQKTFSLQAATVHAPNVFFGTLIRNPVTPRIGSEYQYCNGEPNAFVDSCAS